MQLDLELERKMQLELELELEPEPTCSTQKEAKPSLGTRHQIKRRTQKRGILRPIELTFGLLADPTKTTSHKNAKLQFASKNAYTEGYSLAVPNNSAITIGAPTVRRKTPEPRALLGLSLHFSVLGLNFFTSSAKRGHDIARFSVGMLLGPSLFLALGWWA